MHDKNYFKKYGEGNTCDNLDFKLKTQYHEFKYMKCKK